MLSKQPGASFVLTAKYSDDSGKRDPLGALPVATEPTLGTLAPVGTPTVNDDQYQFTGTVPADAAPGTVYTVEIDAEGDATPGANVIKGQFNIGVVADEDTKVTITGE